MPPVDYSLRCSLMEAGDSGLAAAVLFACSVFSFSFLFFLKVACTSFFHSLCGDGILNLYLESHNDFYPVLHAVPATLDVTVP